MSPLRNGGNGEHATPCQWMSPFRNGGNGACAILCLLLSPFRNGGNGQRVRPCQALTPLLRRNRIMSLPAPIGTRYDADRRGPFVGPLCKDFHDGGRRRVCPHGSGS